jgi:SlyX protein
MEKRIIELERKVTHQDKMIEDLNHALVHQQKRIDLMEKQLFLLRRAVIEGRGGEGGDMPFEKPPHY